MLGKLRERSQKVMAPVGSALARTGITPNMITTLTLVVALLSAYFFYLGDLLLGLALMVLTVVMDMFDGAVARAANLISRFGATFDHTLDRYAEALFMLGLMMGGFVPWFWGYFALFGMLMASFTRAKAESVGGMKDCAVGIAERQEKLIITVAGILLLAVDTVDGWMGYSSSIPVWALDLFLSLQIWNILTICIVIVGVLSHFTVVQRLAYARKVIGDLERNESSDM